eukprot:Rmarinus@m.1850
MRLRLRFVSVSGAFFCGAVSTCQDGITYQVHLRSDSGETVSAAGVQAYFALAPVDDENGGSFVVVATQSGESTVAVTLAPSTAGIYAATVYFDSLSQEVSGSGFHLNITAAAAVPASSAVLAPSGELCRNGSACGPVVVSGEVATFALYGVDICGNAFPAAGFAVIDDGVETFLTKPSVDGQSQVEIPLNQAGTRWVKMYIGNVLPDTIVGSYQISVSAADAAASRSSFLLPCDYLDSCVIGSAGSDIEIPVFTSDVHGNTPAVPTESFWATMSDTMSLLELVLQADATSAWTFHVNATIASVYSLLVEYKGATTADGVVFVTISPATASPSTSTASLVLPGTEPPVTCLALALCGEVAAGSLFDVVLSAKDGYGNSINSSSSSASPLLMLQVSDGAGNTVTNKTFAADNWAVTFSLGAADQYSMEVLIDEVVVSNCPFTLRILPLTTLDAASMRATGDDLYFAAAGTNVTIFVEGRDVYGNALLSGDAATAANFTLQVAGRAKVITAMYTGEGAVYALFTAETVAGILSLSLRYRGDPIAPQSWNVTIVSGPPDASTSTVTLGYVNCVWGEVCGCALLIGNTLEYSLVVRDQFTNGYTGTPEVPCSYVTSSLGVVTESYVGIPRPGGHIDIPFTTRVAAGYTVDVYLGGIPVSNSGFGARFLPRSGLNVSASDSFIMYTEDDLICESGAFCGPILASDSLSNGEETRGCRAGETVAFSLFQVDSALNFVNESSGLYVTAVAIENQNVNDFAVLIWNAYGDGTYKITYEGVMAADWELVVYLGSEIVVDGFFIRVIHADPFGGTTQLMCKGEQCLEGLPCDTEAQVAGTWGSPYEFVPYDAYGNQVLSPLEPSDLTISGVAYLAMNFVVDSDTGAVRVSLYVEAAAEYVMRVHFSVDDSELLGSGLLLTVDPAEASADSSSVVFCSESTCQELCVMEASCPEEPITAGEQAWYTVDLFDVFGNPVIISNEAEFPFGFKTCDVVDVASWEDCPSNSEAALEQLSGVDRFGFTVFQVQAGMQWISVVDAAADLRNSPFYLLVLAGPPSSAESYVLDGDSEKSCRSGVVCSTVFIEEYVSWILVTVDGYGNERSCSPSGCNFWDEEPVLARFSIGGTELPWLGADETGKYQATVTSTEAGTLEVTTHVLVRAEWVPLDLRFDLEVLPGPVDAGSSVVHVCEGELYSQLCDCIRDAVCLTVEAGNYFVMALRFRDRYHNDIAGTERRCLFTIPELNLNGTCAINDDAADLLFAPDLSVAGTFITSVFAWDDDASSDLVSNSGFYLTVNPSTFAPRFSQVYRMPSHTSTDLEAGTLCANATFCGEYSRPAQDVYLLAICLDRFGNRVRNVSDVSLTIDVQAAADDDDGFYKAEITGGEALVAFQLFTRGEYGVVLHVGDATFGNSFLIECNTLELELTFDLQVTVFNSSDLEYVTDEVKASAASSLGVDAERMYVVGYSSSSQEDNVARRRDESGDEPYAVSLLYKPLSREDLYQTESAVVHLDPANVTGETFATDDVAEPSQNDEEVVLQVDRDMSVVRFDGYDCHSQASCPDYALQAGTVTSYEVFVSDAYGNSLSIEIPWFCRVQVLWDGEDLCADGSASCGCSDLADSPGVFALTILLEELHGTDYEAGVYEQGYEVSVFLDGDAIAVSGWLMDVGPSNLTDVEVSRLEGASPSLLLSAIAGVPVDYQVTSRDEYANVRPVFDDAWLAHMVNENATIEFPVSSNPAPGIFLIEALLTRAGSYDLSFVLGGVRNSTLWSVEVIPGPTNASMCEVSVSGLSSGGGFIAGTQTASQHITVVAKDSFGNLQTAEDVLDVYYVFLRGNSRGYLNQPGSGGASGSYKFVYATTLEEVGNILATVYLLTGGQASVVASFDMVAQCPSHHVAVSPEYSGWKHEDDPTKPDYCVICPTTGIDCETPGQTMLALQHVSGWWRASKATLLMNACLNLKLLSASTPETCPGLEGVSACQPCMNITSWAPEDDTTANVGGQCRRGYRGRLCALCDAGYSRSAHYDCTECPDTSALVLGGFVYFFVQSLSIAYQVRKQLTGGRYDYSPELVGMFTDFVQVFLAMKLIDFEGQNFDETIEEVVRPIFLLEPFSLDCVLHEFGFHTNLYFHELRVMSFFPVLGALLVPLCLWLFFKRQVSQKDLFKDHKQTMLMEQRRFRELRGRSFTDVTDEQLHAVSHDPFTRPARIPITRIRAPPCGPLGKGRVVSHAT